MANTPNNEAKPFKTSIGGQALIEGILMRGPKKQAISVRSPEGIITKVEDLKLLREKYPILGVPFIRGIATFGASMVNGVKALMYSAEFFPEDEAAQPDKFDLWLEKKFGSEKAQQLIIYIAAVLGILFSVGLFILLPTFIVSFVPGLKQQYVLRNLVEGLVKMAIFLSYLCAVSRMKDIRRVFSYHGAEHKSIWCYEKRLPLTVENVRAQTRLHPRCGTSFLFVVICISIVVGAFIRSDHMLVRMLLHLLFLPVIVGISYELNRWVGAHDNALSRTLSWPGMQMQHFTTYEPDDSMIEVAIEALKAVIPEEEGQDAW
ncbi:MAG: DUF1385 domain-containing protein [Candidatus Heteroscillospira sp.]|jgi:uncharacterized protein YqhQ